MPFADIPEILDELRAGRMVILVDDPDRENEGDLVMAAEKATPDAINFMIRHGSGIVCLTMPLGEGGRAPPPAPGRDQLVALRHPVHRDDRGEARCHDRSLRGRSRDDDPDGGAGRLPPGGPRATGTRLPDPRGGRRGAQARRTDRGIERPLPPGGHEALRRHLRGDERRRDDGPRAGPREVPDDVRAEDVHRARPDRVPPPTRAPDHARGDGAAADAARDLRSPRLHLEDRSRAAPRADARHRDAAR